jgi:hypothetical protein
MSTAAGGGFSFLCLLMVSPPFSANLFQRIRAYRRLGEEPRLQRGC